MQLSRIELDLANARARGDLADPYEMHSSLSRAFALPGAEGTSVAPFLWRAETVRAGTAPVVLVQSAIEPRWSDVQRRSPGWASRIEVKSLDLDTLVTPGSRLRFRLRANPTVTRQGKRHALLREPEQLEWIQRQGERLGFEVQGCEVGGDQRIVTRKRSDRGVAVTVHAVTFEGVLAVTDRAGTAEAIRHGLGHARFLGLGLFSVAPVVA